MFSYYYAGEGDGEEESTV